MCIRDRGRGGVPPASDLDHPAARRGPVVRARSTAPTVHPVQPDLVDVRGRQTGHGPLLRTGRRPPARPRPQGHVLVRGGLYRGQPRRDDLTTEQAPAAPADSPVGAAATTPPTPPSLPPALTPVELSRWTWRQLTSMRTALILLFLLALAAIPGSVVPQRSVDAIAAGQWREAHPNLTPIYDALGLFSVYNSIWFSAIYILLMISLVGCIVPRLRIYWRGIASRPPRTPRNLSRLPQSRSFEVDRTPAAAMAHAQSSLRKKRYRVDVHEDSVAGERGYLREAGNLLFHVSVVLVLVGFAVGNLFGYKGGVIVVDGQGFSNSLSQYDDFAPGSMFDPDDLAPFNLNVDDFDVQFLESGPQAGMPTDFSADQHQHHRHVEQQVPGFAQVAALARNRVLVYVDPVPLLPQRALRVGHRRSRCAVHLERARLRQAREVAGRSWWPGRDAAPAGPQP